MIEIVEITELKPERCREVLDDLPDWFGIPEATDAYVQASAHLPMRGVYENGELAGFVSVKQQTEFAAELYVMGVKRRFHRRGVGRLLIEAVERDSIRDGLRFLTVKTLAPSHPDPNYADTRRFYDAAGFVPIEIFPALWGEDNPCLLMLKPLLGAQ